MTVADKSRSGQGKEVKRWCMDHRPCYKEYIPGVLEYFCQSYRIDREIELINLQETGPGINRGFKACRSGYACPGNELKNQCVKIKQEVKL